jgi:MinD-like ATPase involved in chromosome partitioning or flagellar assembly
LAVGLGFCALRHPLDRALLIEADPAGGILSSRFALPTSPSLASLASDISRGAGNGLIESHAVDLHGVACVPAPADPLVVEWALGRGGPALAEALPSMAQPVIVDLGRAHPRSPSLHLAAASDMVLLVTRPTLDEAQSALFAVRTLKAVGCPAVGLVTVGDKPHHPGELADAAGIPLIGVVPDDPIMARSLVGGRFRAHRLPKSLLWRSIDAIAESLFVSNRPVTPAPPLPSSTAPRPQAGNRSEVQTAAGSTPSAPLHEHQSRNPAWTP